MHDDDVKAGDGEEERRTLDGGESVKKNNFKKGANTHREHTKSVFISVID